MNLPLFIARRTAHSTASTQSTMVRIATLAVAISVAVMVVTIAVVAGFRKQIRAAISDFAADIVITDLATIYGAESRPITQDSSLTTIFDSLEGVESISPYAMRGTIIRSQNDATGLVIKGIDNFSDKQSLLDAIVEGSAPRIEEQRHKEILLPELVAKKLGVKSGERVELLSLSEGKPPKRDVFKICGLYRTMGELPVPIALTDIRNVQKINGWQSGTLSGFEIRTSEGVDNYLLSEQINNSLFEDYTGDANLSSVSAEQLYSNIFTWLETHDINATVIITIMFIVALFNMITALLIMLFERTRMVGILKSLGMSNSSIRKIFLYQAARIITIGLIVGNAIAIVLILVQKYTGVIKLDSSAYFVSQVPVSIGVVEILIINTIFATAILALLFAVTAIVSQIKPSEAVKYE